MSKGILKTIGNILRFNSAVTDNFELLENEYGQPTPSTNKYEESDEQSTEPDAKLFCELSKNTDKLKTTFKADISNDLVVREFMFCGKIRAAIAYINGMVNGEMINDFILRDAMKGKLEDTQKSLHLYAIENIFTACDISAAENYSTVTKAITEGLTAVFIDTCATACIVDTRLFPQRSIEASENEKTVHGPKEAFIENIRSNISLIRRHLHTNDMVCELRSCGTQTKTNIAILYRDKVANHSLVCEVKRRIAKIKTRTVFDAGTINQLIEKNPFSPIPQTLLTEKPDRCASYLSEGHVVLLCDGCPTAIILPVTLFSLMSTSEDVYNRQLFGNVLRIVRYIGALISLYLPGIFIAIVMYHQGFLSSEMLNTLITSRQMVFIPIGIELLMLLFVFQLIREAGMRVPGSIGQAIGIIGGLVLGQAVVSANLASSVMLILVALTGLGSFCIPDYSLQVCTVYFRVIFIVVGWIGGFLGITCASLIFIAYLTTLKSFGVPFLTPYSPKTYSKRLNVLRGPITNDNTKKEDYMQ